MNEQKNETVSLDAVYYSRQYNRFFRVIEEKETGCVCSDFCGFYADTMTVIGRQQLSNNFILGCIPVNNIDEFPFAELYAIGSMRAWKVKEY